MLMDFTNHRSEARSMEETIEPDRTARLEADHLVRQGTQYVEDTSPRFRYSRNHA